MLARVGIKSIIPWNEYGFEVVGDFDNGQKALEMIEELNPDIVITDIKMPVLNGIDLIKKIKEKKINSKFIVMSSYEDFKYVKEAMKLGVEDFILKLEMEQENLLELLKKIAEKIECENNEKNRIITVDKYYKENIYILRGEFIRELIFGDFVNTRKIEDRMRYLNISLPQENLICIVIDIVNKEMFSRYDEKDTSTLKFAVINVLEEIVLSYGNGYVYGINEWKYAMVVSLAKGDNLSNNILSKLVNSIETLMLDTLNITVAIGMSDIQQHYTDISNAYKQALKILKDKRSSVQNDSIVKLVTPIEKELKELEAALLDLDLNKVISAISSLKQKVNSFKTFQVNTIKGICHTLIFLVNMFIQKTSIESFVIWGKAEDPYIQVESINSLEDFNELLSDIRDSIEKILRADKDSKTTIIRAKQYIKKHFRENILLEDVAESLELSPNYFSRLFRKETGESFIEYLIRIRIDEAKYLLKNSNSKVYEVAEMVGYNNPHYFSRIFKKVTGVTPLEYR